MRRPLCWNAGEVPLYTIEIFLPTYDNEGAPLPRELFADVRAQMTARFGGVTAFTRAPAVGIWKDDEGVARRDDIVIFEVIAGELDREWWASYRGTLEKQFRQEEILIRATATQRL